MSPTSHNHSAPVAYPGRHPWTLWLLWAFPAMLVVGCWWGNPFQRTISEQRQSLNSLSAAQRSNVRLAAQALNGLILPAGEPFSFNRVVGPRTRARGYRAAPSYLGPESPSTLGGGICLLSSALYQLALKTGLSIEQRVPHLRVIHSVPPGLDATVWYGGADLKFTNQSQQPLQLVVREDGSQLSVAFKGAHEIAPVHIRRERRQPNSHTLQVLVFLNQRLISRDRYRLTP